MDRWVKPEQRKKFMAEQGIGYLEQAVFSDLPAFKRELAESPYYLENREEFDHLSALYGSSIRSHALAPVSIRFISKEVGYGLFTEEDLDAGAFIGEYTGVVQEGLDLPPVNPDAGSFDTDYTWDYPDAWYDDILYEINALKKGNELRYVNHSFEPNLVVEHTLLDNRWVVFFVCEHPLKAGTQLTVDYGEEYWSGGFRELILF